MGHSCVAEDLGDQRSGRRARPVRVSLGRTERVGSVKTGYGDGARQILISRSLSPGIDTSDSECVRDCSSQQHLRSRSKARRLVLRQSQSMEELVEDIEPVEPVRPTKSGPIRGGKRTEGPHDKGELQGNGRIFDENRDRLQLVNITNNSRQCADLDFHGSSQDGLWKGYEVSVASSMPSNSTKRRVVLQRSKSMEELGSDTKVRTTKSINSTEKLPNDGEDDVVKTQVRSLEENRRSVHSVNSSAHSARLRTSLRVDKMREEVMLARSASLSGFEDLLPSNKFSRVADQADSDQLNSHSTNVCAGVSMKSIQRAPSKPHGFSQSMKNLSVVGDDEIPDHDSGRQAASGARHPNHVWRRSGTFSRTMTVPATIEASLEEDNKQGDVGLGRTQSVAFQRRSSVTDNLQQDKAERTKAAILRKVHRENRRIEDEHVEAQRKRLLRASVSEEHEAQAEIVGGAEDMSDWALDQLIDAHVASSAIDVNVLRKFGLV